MESTGISENQFFKGKIACVQKLSKRNLNKTSAVFMYNCVKIKRIRMRLVRFSLWRMKVDKNSVHKLHAKFEILHLCKNLLNQIREKRIAYDKSSRVNQP